ncbi:MAG: NAD(+) synthase, partial [Erysipelotrichia bacterium]|nr:NAD(+) synthase [Erysipelotrichia bacterium]
LQIQANGLATRIRAAGIKTLVIGVSGGLDSTLALIVCAEAKRLVPDIRIIGITMPNTGNTTGRTYENAIALMKLLRLDDIREIPIDEGVQDHLKAIGHSAEYQGESDTAYENAQARMRTYILMDVANMENGLVVGTGDLSELALGWCTYNGDHMSMYGVNASVPKTLVQYISRTYAETCGNRELHDVLIDICDTPITPELTPSSNGKIVQKTEEKIGKYDLNDFFLFYTLRYGFEPSRILALAMHAYPMISREQIQSSEVRFFNRFFHQQFKHSCLPDGPKVGSVTLSPRGDWRMPSDADVELWLKELSAAK